MALKLSDMKRTAADKKAEQARYKDGPSMPGGDDYGHGMHLELDHHGMQKVGMDDMPSSGDEYHGEFHGRVVDTHEDSEDGQEPRRRVRVLVHHLGMEPKGGKDGDGDTDRPRSGLRSTIEKAAEKADKAISKAE
jgi:hypothetical protein